MDTIEKIWGIVEDASLDDKIDPKVAEDIFEILREILKKEIG